MYPSVSKTWNQDLWNQRKSGLMFQTIQARGQHFDWSGKSWDTEVWFSEDLTCIRKFFSNYYPGRFTPFWVSEHKNFDFFFLKKKLLFWGSKTGNKWEHAWSDPQNMSLLGDQPFSFYTGLTNLLRPNKTTKNKYLNAESAPSSPDVSY